MNFKTFFMAFSVVLLASSAAKSADVIVVSEPSAIILSPSYSWAGAYLGGQVGYGWGKSAFDDGGDISQVKPDGFLGGVYAGYNFDAGNNVILGVDGDMTFNNAKDAYSEGSDGAADNLISKLRWTGAARARFGVAVDRFLPYIAGGVAFGRVQNSLSFVDELNNLSTSQTETKTGWTLGAGVDYAAADNVIVRLEYRYTDYGRKSFDGTSDGFEFSMPDKLRTSEVRLGLAYKF